MLDEHPYLARQLSVFYRHAVTPWVSKQLNKDP
jgi:hypothetical protein